ncbi:MAG: hypothetical protein JWN78_2434 [Bacteroidota bacterium]|nr:hypothetical protein [Bacteroidota bacterium]
MKEDEIRDLLAGKLHLIQEGLILIEKEKYFPSLIGTRSFIDLFAKDNNGKFVIIELKRSNAAAREAIHELLKYLEAIKENISVKEDEIRLIIVSTEWEELLVPFSSFVQKTNINVEGFQLNISSEEALINAEKTKPVSLIEDRVLSAVQMAHYYLDSKSLEQGVLSHNYFFNSHSIQDYVLIILKAPLDYHARIKDSLAKSIDDIISKLEINDESRINQMKKNIDEHYDFKYMIYSANQLLSEEKYIEVLNKISEYPELINEIIEDREVTKLDKLEQLNEQLINCEPFPESDYVEIGTPSKYSKFVNIEGWEIHEIKRFGRLKENKLLTDETIENEILGSAGTSREKYNSELFFHSKSTMSRVRKEISNCLSNNNVWKNHIFHILDELSTIHSIKKCTCSIYNPMNIIYSIHLITTRPDGVLYIPSYQIIVEFDDETWFYAGYLGSNLSNKVKLNEVIQNFYGGDLFEFFLSLTWGGYVENNLEICRHIGLAYNTMLFKIKNDVRSAFKYENYAFIPAELIFPLHEIINFIEDNEELCDDINKVFEDHETSPGVFSI